MLEWRNRGLADHFSEAVVALIREGPLRRTRRRASLAEIAARGRRQLSYRNDGAIECTGTPAHRGVPPVTTGGERFVRTADMRAVIKGREADLLDALNIPWRAGNAHIRCPYPGHSDANPSWHWDRRKDRAYSTCIAGAHTALDMLMAVEEATFEAAKIRGADWALVQHRSQNPGDPPFPFPRTQRVKPTIAAEQNWNQ